MNGYALLTEQESADLTEIQRLLDEAYKNYYEKGDGYGKSAEGHVEVAFGNTFDRRSGERLRPVTVYSYVFGRGRSHFFDTPAEALEEVRGWHAEEMARDYAAEEAEEAAFWAAKDASDASTP